MSRLPSILALALVSVAASAAPIWMTDSELTATFSGQALEGEYASGRSFEETYQSDGHVAYIDEIRTNGGHWSVQSGSFCTIYDDDQAGGCFRVLKSGSNCFEFYFIARTEDEARTPKPGEPDWTARAWRKNETSTCKEHISA